MMVMMLVLMVQTLRVPAMKAMVVTVTSIYSAPFMHQVLAVCQRKHLGGG